MSIIILVNPPEFLLSIKRYINFMPAPPGWSRYPLPSSKAFFVNCCDFCSFSRFTTRISIRPSSYFFRSIHIYCRTCFSISQLRSLSSRLSVNCLRSICLFLGFMSLFFIELFLSHCLLIFRYRSFKNIKKNMHHWLSFPILFKNFNVFAFNL